MGLGNLKTDVEPLLAQLLDMHRSGTVRTLALARYVAEAWDLPYDVQSRLNDDGYSDSASEATILYLAALGQALTPDRPQVSVRSRQERAVKEAVPYRFDACMAVLLDLRWSNARVPGGTVREVGEQLRDVLQDRTRDAVRIILERAAADDRVKLLD